MITALIAIVAIIGYIVSIGLVLIGVQEKRDALAGWGVAGLIVFGLMLGGLGERCI